MPKGVNCLLIEVNVLFFCQLRLYQVGNTSSRKITDVSNLATVSTWMGDHSSVEVDAVVKNTVNTQEWSNRASNMNS